MPTIITYQRLFEVRILHEYYLLGPSVPSYFNLPQADRETIFRNRVLWNQYPLRQDLEIEPDEKTKAILKGLDWRFLPTAAGFLVAASARPFSLTGGSAATRPAIAPPTGAQLLFHIRPKNRLFHNFTALPLRRQALETSYYFANRASSVQAVGFASLSAPVKALQANSPYEMGDLAVIGGGLKEALQNTDGNNTTTHWRDLAGTGYVNESDRICLPKAFHYPFAATDNVQTATFILQQPDGTPVRTVVINGDATHPVINAAVSFKPRPPDGLYRLKIDAGPIQKTLDVFLTDAYDPSALGIVHLNLQEADPIYRVLGAEGQIRNENTDPAGKPIPPVFDIRLRSRRTIWRYLSYFNNRRIQPNGLADHLKAEGNTTVTLAPQPFTLLPLGVSSPTPSIAPAVLPKAYPAALKPQPPDLLYTDIKTFQTNGLNEVPI